ncbi:MAG: DUF58 domain-containing protein [Clostridiales bacterium]|jgi:uncharacterized protein (DUF58 family)|nr:DUF58 domain-containing protein [Clostridiales bacterium]
MSITLKFAKLEFIAIGVVLLASVFGFGMIVFAACNLALAALFIADWIGAPKAGCFAVTREPGDKLCCRAENVIGFSVSSTHGKAVKLFLKDTPPDFRFSLDESDMAKVIPPSGRQGFSYIAIPMKRGSFLFEGVFCIAEGSLGLFRRRFFKKLPRDFKVYPDMRNLSKYRLMARNKRLLAPGPNRAKLRGAGVEFESLREYVDGDDTRKLNWMASARQGKLMVNQYESEKNQPVFILVDAGRSMSSAAKGREKLDYSIEAALILADIVNQQGDVCGILVFDSAVKTIVMPGKGASHRTMCMDVLYNIEGVKSASDYEGAFLELMRRQKRSGLVFVFTDFETPEEAKDISAALSLLKKRHIPLLMLMESEGLRELADMKAKTEKEAFEKAAAARYLYEKESLCRSLGTRGCACIRSEAGAFALAAVNNYLAAKR